MLKKVLTLCTLAICGFSGLHATETEQEECAYLTVGICVEKEEAEGILAYEEKSEDLAPGALTCNSQEEQCVKEGEQEDAAFTLTSLHEKEEEVLLACKRCR